MLQEMVGHGLYLHFKHLIMLTTLLKLQMGILLQFGGHAQKGQAFIARLSDGGILQWIKRFGQLNTPKDTFWEVVEADDGGIVAVGSKLEDREFYFYDHFWFLKVDAEGNEVWSREIGTNDRYDMAFDVIKMPDTE